MASEISTYSNPTSKKKIKVLLVDDHKMMRTGLKTIINREDDLVVIGEVDNGDDVLKEAKATSPDVIIMDINLPGINGIEATRLVHEEMPQVRVIGLSLHDNESVAEAMREAGATAYLTKSEAFEALTNTIRSEANSAE